MSTFSAREEMDFLNKMASKYGFKTTEQGVEICSCEIDSGYNFKLGWSTYFRDFLGLSSFWIIENERRPNYSSLNLKECKEETFPLSIFSCVEDINILTPFKDNLITCLNKIFDTDYYSILSFGIILKSEAAYTYEELRDFLSQISIPRKDDNIFITCISATPLPIIRISEDKNNIYIQLVNMQDGNIPLCLKELNSKALREEIVIRVADKYDFTLEETVIYDSKLQEAFKENMENYPRRGC